MGKPKPQKKEYTTVSIPKPLADRVREHIKETGFYSLSNFVEYVLREIISLKRDDEDTINEKLMRLGYLK